MSAYIATWIHKLWVAWYIFRACLCLMRRAIVHDGSKLTRSEWPIFSRYTKRLKGMTYGSDEYKQCLAEMQPALDHHYKHNDHHPEHHGPGWEMGSASLLALIEMICDWKAATRRHKDGDISKSIVQNAARFKYDEHQWAQFAHTALELGFIKGHTREYLGD